MKQFNLVKDAVSMVLLTNRKARNSDWICIKETMKFFVDTNKSLDEICDLGVEGELPTFESIRRYRQKIQEIHPELRGDENVRRFRKEREAEVRELMKGAC